MNEILGEWAANPSPRLIYLIPAFAFLETAPFIGIFVSGIFLLGTATLLYTSGSADIALIVTLAYTGALAGDVSGYFVGRLMGHQLDALAVMKKYRERRAKIARLIERLGPFAICIGRLTPAIRSITPIVVGMSDMPFRRYMPWELLALSIWASGLFLIVTSIARLGSV